MHFSMDIFEKMAAIFFKPHHVKEVNILRSHNTQPKKIYAHLAL